MRSPESVTTRKGFWEGFSFYGIYLVVIPVFASGPLAIIAKAIGWHGPLALLIILPLGFGVGIWLLVKEVREEARRHFAAYDLYKRDWEGKQVDVIIVEDVCEAIEVDDLEDFGPGYVLKTSDGECLYVAGQMLLDCEDPEFPSQAVEIEYWPHSRELYAVRCWGEPVPIRGWVSINDLPTDLLNGCELLAVAPIPHAAAEESGILEEWS